MKTNRILAVLAMTAVLSACNSGKNVSTVSETGAEASAEQITSVTEEEIPEIDYTGERRAIANWFNNMSDSEYFPDIKNYQYYARALDRDSELFLSPDMWEIYYSEELNRNREIENKAVYLIRLNPQKLIEIYAERNGCSESEICKKMTATKAQLYYNWGYTATSNEYEDRHSNNKVSYSEDEETIFGIHNNEDRTVVMRTHQLTIDLADSNAITYNSKPSDKLRLNRRDRLQFFSDIECSYSSYTDTERSALLTVNGIGIRAVIPLSLENGAAEISEEDKAIVPMINVSPFSYGCTDSDRIDISEYYKKEEQ